MKKIIIISSIILLAFFLRIFYLDQVPAGADPDEAEFVFNAYTISKYLKSGNSELLPYQINTYGNFRPLGLVYFLSASIKIFGNTIFAIRLPTAIFGVISVLLIYVLFKLITAKTKIAETAALLMAINPWHVFFSRGSCEQILALIFITLMLICLILYNREQKIRYLFLIYLSAVMAFFSYSGALTIIFLFAFCMMMFEYIKNKKIIWMQIMPFILIVIFPVLFVFLTNPGFLNGRMKQVSVFYGQGKFGIKLVTEEQIRENGFHRSSYQNTLTRFFHNVPINTANVILDNWTKHLSFDFLYLKSGPPKRLQVPMVGNFLVIESLFLFGGALLMFQHKKYNLFFLSLSIILLGFLPAGLTVEEVPSTSRTIFVLIGFFLYESYFLWWLANNNHKLVVVFLSLLTVAIFFYQMSVYLHDYFILQPRHQNWYRKPELQEVAWIMNHETEKYDEVFIVKDATEPAYFYYFFNNLDPLPFINNSKKDYLGNWQEGKFHYIHDKCVYLDDNGKVNLIIESAECVGQGKIIKYIYGSDGGKVLVMRFIDFKNIYAKN